MANLQQSGIGVVGSTDSVDTVAQNILGTTARDSEGNEYIYLQGVANTIAGSIVTFDEAFSTALAVPNAIGSVAVAMAAVVADRFGWYQIFGSATGKVLTGFADNSKVYLTATSGYVDDADVAGDLVVGMWGRSTRNDDESTATLQLSYPLVTDEI